MDSIFSILGNKDFDEPPEISSVKKYVFDEFGVKPTVKVSGTDIVISVPNAALITTLRLRGPEIKRRCQLDKKLIFRIG